MKRGPQLPPLGYSEARELERKRARSGYTSLRISRLTREVLTRLVVHYKGKNQWRSLSVDELLYRLGIAIVGEASPAKVHAPNAGVSSMHPGDFSGSQLLPHAVSDRAMHAARELEDELPDILSDFARRGVGAQRAVDRTLHAKPSRTSTSTSTHARKRTPRPRKAVTPKKRGKKR